VNPHQTSPKNATRTEVRHDLTELDGTLPDNEVHVWQAEIVASEAVVGAGSNFLDAGEHARASRFLVAGAREQFVLSRAFLRFTLGRYLRMDPRELRFRTAEYGKPELAGDADLKFNLSHTEGATVIAVTRAGRVGVDVERIRENLDPIELGDRFFSRKEAEWLRSQSVWERFAAFFACWTAKEAYIKAWGEGLSMPLADFGLIPKGGNAKLELEVYGKPGSAENWSIWQLDAGPGLCSATAVECRDCIVRAGKWSFDSML